jgi:2-desacetyl-2-hydroxyethyl bacteriochlorophyllide A dehydrogenase
MKALVLKSPENLEVMDVPVPILSADQVLIKVSKCGLCGSDIRYFHGENPWAKQTLQRDIPNPPNIIFGHEFVGTVAEVGDSADKHLIGKRVGVQTWDTCGRCAYCRSGRENFCRRTRHLGHGQGWGEMDFYPGGMAEYCPASSKNVYELPDSVSDEQATFLDPLTAAVHAVDVAPPAVLDHVVVLGAGPIGLMIAQLARAYGSARTVITDISERNLRIALELGVDHALKIEASGTSVRDFAAAELGAQGVARVYNTVGTNESIVESLEMLDVGGTAVLMATKEEHIHVPALLLSGERSMKSSTNAMFRDFGRAIDLLATGMVRVDPLVTHRFSLSDGVKAFETACDKATSESVKIVIDCEA